eukprot:CAMPEP_0196663152 /NCGR_PEP_ID=MMETSP1086-20130531/51695_1 /TAXON_ID=77921 /ORGANISM="Cyanoptyche  gloeocystis , Strain SAG4.97" /LENGTH=180 /DNA_ID=CAMNT_0041998859 /DNA_START=147 /DNA_END=685 /DNA_ORIENTATION=-
MTTFRTVLATTTTTVALPDRPTPVGPRPMSPDLPAGPPTTALPLATNAPATVVTTTTVAVGTPLTPTPTWPHGLTRAPGTTSHVSHVTGAPGRHGPSRPGMSHVTGAGTASAAPVPADKDKEKVKEIEGDADTAREGPKERRLPPENSEAERGPEHVHDHAGGDEHVTERKRGRDSTEEN